MAGWFKLYRQILHSNVFDNPKLLKVWIWCLAKAAYADYEQVVGRQVVPLKSGQFVYGRRKAALELGLAESTIRDYMKMLVDLGNVRMEPTNKFTIVTVCQWELYQSKDDKPDNKRTTDRPTNGQQIGHKKEYKEDQEKKKYSDQVYHLLDYWNKKEIVVHRETDNTLKQIQRGLKKHPLNDIKKAIDRYAIIYSDSNYFYKHKWTLPKFLNQQNGVPDFLDEGIRWINYKQEAQNNKPSRPLEFYIPEDDNANS